MGMSFRANKYVLIKPLNEGQCFRQKRLYNCTNNADATCCFLEVNETNELQL